MDPKISRVPKSRFIYHQDTWFSGIDNSMKMLGSAQIVSAEDMIRLQNEAIRDCWVVTGNRLRQAMIALSNRINVYPEELKDDETCRKMLTKEKVRA